MGKGQCVAFVLLVINLVFTIVSVGTMAFGLICFLGLKQNPSKSNTKSFIDHRMLLAIDSSQHFHDQVLPKNWFVFLLIATGATLFIISCCGHVGTTFRSPCCLLSYCALLVALVTVELGTAAFIFFKHNWKEIMPIDRNGNFQKAHHFLNIHWNVIKWVALGVLITQVIAIVLAVYLQSVFKPPKLYGKRDEHEQVDYFPPFRSGIPNYRFLEENKIKTNPSPRNST